MISKLLSYDVFILRFILSLAFLGHGLVSLNLSPSYNLHYNLIDAVNITSFSTQSLITFQAFFDITISVFLFLFNRSKYIFYIILIYLFLVCLSAMIFYYEQTNYIFGFAECLRRLPWVFISIFLIYELLGIKKYFLIRIALSFAFLSHGFASLGFLGLNQGHIDLAMQIVSKENARLFVTYTGFSDIVIGLFLLLGILTRYFACIGALWIIFIIYLSFLNAFPDAIFRFGFFILAIYVIIDKRCYTPKFIKI